MTDSLRTTDSADTNPLLEPSTLPLGIPDFAAITPAHIAAALSTGLDDHAAEIAAIIANPAPATVANTLDAFEASGQLLARASRQLYNLISADLTEELRAIEQDFGPRYSAHRDSIWQNPTLYERFEQLAAQAEKDPALLSAEQQIVLERILRDFRRSGVAATPEVQAQIATINSRLAELSTAFSTALKDATRNGAVLIADAAQLAGLSDAQLAALNAAATAQGQTGYRIDLALPSLQPLLAQLDNREIREQLYAAAARRGAADTASATGEIVLEIVRLRAQRAELLGYAHHADYVTEVETAGSAAAVRDLLTSLIPAAVTNADHEVKKMAEEVDYTPQAFDLPALQAAVARRESGVSDAELSEYFELHSAVHQGVFAAAQALYGVRLQRREDLQGYHPDVEVYEVRDADGQLIGGFLLDLYARPSKNGGAWMTSFVSQSELLGTLPVVVNVLNITQPAGDDPALLTLDEVRTLFHEFGHGLHGLLSAVRYPSVSGTHVPRDFVEYPSQLNEMWALHADVLPGYATHWQTGEPMPAEMADQARALAAIGQGVATTEYLAAAYLDLAWHSLSAAEAAAVTDVAAFEYDALTAAGFDPELIAPRYRSTYFQHIFNGGYSAGYYSYLWAEALDADTEAWFNAQGGLNAEAGQRYREQILSRGGALDFLGAYEQFIGRPRDVEPLLVRRGLAGAA